MVQKQQNLIKLASPNITKKDIKKVVNVLKSGNLVEGVHVKCFEEKLSKFTNIKYTSVVSSATAGLHLLLRALDIGVGDFVIVPSFTFPATANAAENLGANVIFCEVNKNSYVVEPKEIEKTIKANIKKNIKAIIVVHEFGYPANIKKIVTIAKKYNIKVIEDGACALGTVANGHHIGHYSDGAVFSFHPRKAITSGEGGAVVSRHKRVINKIKVFKNHGIFVENGEVDFVEAGLNYRLTDFQAALLCEQIERFKNEIKKRKKLAKFYNQNLCNLPFLSLPTFDKNHSWQSYMIVLDEKIDRKKLIEYFQSKNIQVNLGAQSLPMLGYYDKKYKLNIKDFKNSNRLFLSGLVLPLYGKLNKKELLRVVNTLKKYIETLKC